MAVPAMVSLLPAIYSANQSKSIFYAIKGWQLPSFFIYVKDNSALLYSIPSYS